MCRNSRVTVNVLKGILSILYTAQMTLKRLLECGQYCLWSRKDSAREQTYTVKRFFCIRYRVLKLMLGGCEKVYCVMPPFSGVKMTGSLFREKK